MNERESILFGLKKTRKTTLIVVACAFAFLFLMGILLYISNNSFDLDWLGLVAIIFIYPSVITGIVAVVMYVKAGKRLSKLNHLYCVECGEKYEYDAVQSKVLKNGSRKSGTGYKTYTVVDFVCNCTSCGGTYSFQKEFVTGTSSTDSNGNYRSDNYDLNAIVENYFEKL